MKMKPADYADLRDAVEPFIGFGASERERWDGLWSSRFDVVGRLYPYLNDDHIDTALRRIAAESSK